MSVERGFLGPLKAALCCNFPLTRSGTSASVRSQKRVFLSLTFRRKAV